MIKAFTYILENDAAVQALVGKNKADDKYKVYPIVAPKEEKWPYIAVRTISRISAGKDCGYEYTVQIACWHNSFDRVTDLKEAVIAALVGKTGDFNDVEVGYINYADEQDDFVQDGELYVKINTFTANAGT